jgi:hypothetical protein
MQVRNEDNFGKQEYSPADDLFSGRTSKAYVAIGILKSVI